MRRYIRVALVTHRNSNGEDQSLVPKSSGFHELLIEELHMKPLAGYFAVLKLTHAPFKRVSGSRCVIQCFSFFMHNLCKKKKQYYSSSWFTPAPSSPRISLFLMEH